MRFILLRSSVPKEPDAQKLSVDRQTCDVSSLMLCSCCKTPCRKGKYTGNFLDLMTEVFVSNSFSVTDCPPRGVPQSLRVEKPTV